VVQRKTQHPVVQRKTQHQAVRQHQRQSPSQA
jgi:hypothetical protein